MNTTELFLWTDPNILSVIKNTKTDIKAMKTEVQLVFFTGIFIKRLEW